MEVKGFGWEWSSLSKHWTGARREDSEVIISALKEKTHSPSSSARKRKEKGHKRKTCLEIPYSVAEAEADQGKGIKEMTIKRHATELYFPHQQQGRQGALSLLLWGCFLLEKQ